MDRSWAILLLLSDLVVLLVVVKRLHNIKAATATNAQAEAIKEFGQWYGLLLLCRKIEYGACLEASWWLLYVGIDWLLFCCSCSCRRMDNVWQFSNFLFCVFRLFLFILCILENRKSRVCFSDDQWFWKVNGGVCGVRISSGFELAVGTNSQRGRADNLGRNNCQSCRQRFRAKSEQLLVHAPYCTPQSGHEQSWAAIPRWYQTMQKKGRRVEDKQTGQEKNEYLFPRMEHEIGWKNGD